MFDTKMLGQAILDYMPGILIPVLFVFLLLLGLIIQRIRKSKKQKKYLESFQRAYERKESVASALEEVRSCFKERSKEAQVIRQAVFYLNHSIFMDYETAFDIIEERFKGKKIRNLHDQILEKEKAKKSGMLLLTVKN